MKQTITETKIRSIVRKELQSYLIQEGLWDNIKGAATALKKDLGGHFGQNIQNIGKNIGIPGKSIEEYEKISTILKKVNVSAEPLKNAYIIYTKDKKEKFVYAGELLKEAVPFAIQKIKELQTILKPLFDYIEDKKSPIQRSIKETDTRTAFGVQPEVAKTQEETLADYAKKIETIKTDSTEQKKSFLSENNQAGALILDIIMFAADIAGRLVATDLFPAHVKIARQFFETILKHLGTLQTTPPPEQTPETPA